MMKAIFTVERIEDKGKYKAKATIEILNPQPESAKFFDRVHPDRIVLDGMFNKITKSFDTEKDGREWANKMLLAVMRKSYGEVMRGTYTAPYKQIEIMFNPQSDCYLPDLLPPWGAPDCFGTYEADNDGCSFCDSNVSLCKEQTHQGLIVSCRRCDGTGFYTTCYHECSECGHIKTGSKKCPDCQGTGKILPKRN